MLDHSKSFLVQLCEHRILTLLSGTECWPRLCPRTGFCVSSAGSLMIVFLPRNACAACHCSAIEEIFDNYLQIRIKVAEQSIQEQFEKENTAKIEELKEKLAKATGS